MKYRLLAHTVVVLGVVCALASCRPKGVLSSGQMEDLFVDLHRAEGIIYVRGYKNGHDSIVTLTYDSVLAAHGVTRAQLDSSLVWYTDNPMLFNKIYPHVLARLEALQEEERRRNEEDIRREKEEMRSESDDKPNHKADGHAKRPSVDAARLLRKGK